MKTLILLIITTALQAATITITVKKGDGTVDSTATITLPDDSTIAKLTMKQQPKAFQHIGKVKPNTPATPVVVTNAATVLKNELMGKVRQALHTSPNAEVVAAQKALAAAQASQDAQVQ